LDLMSDMHECSALREAIIKGDAPAAASEARKLLAAGSNPGDLISEGVGPSMAVVGRLFENGECFVPELLMAARATKEIFQIIRPLLAQTDTQPKGRVVLGTVRGDLHDIGKNLVAAMLEGGGFEVIDLGVDVPAEKFIASVKEKQARIVGLSALLTSTLPAMKTVIEAFQAAGVREQVKIMVGGAPVTESFAAAIGADGYGESAAASVDLASRLAGK
jgi:5-methyltetrahydrofolate--homocysteine methyltransferase